MGRNRRALDTVFTVELEHLVKTAYFSDGSWYQHRCHLEAYQQVAHAIEESAETGTTGHEIAAAENIPFTQAHIALAFLKERGCVTLRYRRTFPASAAMYEDAMIEFHALQKQPPK